MKYNVEALEDLARAVFCKHVCVYVRQKDGKIEYEMYIGHDICGQGATLSEAFENTMSLVQDAHLTKKEHAALDALLEKMKAA